ncbi:MAG: UDP-N-acetylmuramoyl-L-alanine--D-glutamate ligase [Elusimicrobiota bacterium]
MTQFNPKAFSGGRAGILGLGKSGLACAKLLAKKGFSIVACDAKPASQIRKLAGRLSSKISLESGGRHKRLLRCAFIVKSPGINPQNVVLKRAKILGIPIFSELEVALAFCKSRNIIAVTGTNGKTTTVALLGKMLERGLLGKHRSWPCGNIGIPVSDVALKAGSSDWLVVETSSYQLEDSGFFRPRIAVILNVTPDHIDHHGKLSAYIRAKAKVFSRQEESETCVFNADDPTVFKLSRECRARKIYFTLNKTPGSTAWIERGKIVVRRYGGHRSPVFLPAPDLKGEHNLQNAMAASLAAMQAGMTTQTLRAALRAFRGVEHRMESVGVFRNMLCVNDSKATNVDSTIMALRAFPDRERIFLILGGRHKGSSYHPLRPLIKRKVKAILTIGEAAAVIEKDLGDIKTVLPCGALEAAVKTAFEIGGKGDIILLSPACASFDQFLNFEDRGQCFKKLVRGFGQ